MRIVKGTLLTSRKYTRTQEYTVKNSGSHAKKVLVEYPLDPNWTLVSPKEPAEKTRQLYRFAVDAQPGKPAKLAVEEERTDQQQWALGNLDNGTIFVYQRANETSPKVKEALAEVIKRHEAIEQTRAKAGSRRKSRSEPSPPIKAASARTWPSSITRPSNTRIT